MKIRNFVAAIGIPALLAISNAAAAQQATCGTALYQLQAYAAQVNQVAQFEYYQGIPYRCGYNAYCGNAQLYQLQQWYGFQASQVNGWYQQLVSQCASQAPVGQRRRKPGSDDLEQGIDEQSLEELEVDDEDKTVVLRIPDNPKGFRPQ
ncbi:hypothetical protein [Sphingopyxis sp. PET50]|uniref:hypothetical protein n=1 Tax=Sphingopyxis sp. PET50 TaxID=2976533 RepID=UPI0021AF0A3E|nr:hypothetical protein [Sphingopyxis sp. PET50]